MQVAHPFPERTREQIQAVYDEAVEAVRTAMSRGTPLTDQERAKYGLTYDRWISYISENMTDGTEHSEGQAGAERDSTADSGEEYEDWPAAIG